MPLQAAHRYKFELSTVSLATCLLDRYFVQNSNQVRSGSIAGLQKGCAMVLLRT